MPRRERPCVEVHQNGLRKTSEDRKIEKGCGTLFLQSMAFCLRSFDRSNNASDWPSIILIRSRAATTKHRDLHPIVSLFLLLLCQIANHEDDVCLVTLGNQLSVSTPLWNNNYSCQRHIKRHLKKWHGMTCKPQQSFYNVLYQTCLLYTSPSPRDA